MRLFFITALLFLAHIVQAQKFTYGIGYDYLYSREWDAAIQTYNFSRPHIINEQPLLIHSPELDFEWTLKTKGKLQHGLEFNWNWCGSRASNTDLSVALHYHFLQPGYFFRYFLSDRNKAYIQSSVGVRTGVLFKRVNGEAYLIDEKRRPALGAGAHFNLFFGYNIALRANMIISPYVGAGCSPYYFSPYTEAILNQTVGMTGNKYTTVISGQAGVKFYFVRSESGVSNP
jgi:hypothetical protein